MTDAQLHALLHRRVEVCGKRWIVAAVIASEKPWCWVVNLANREVQARYPARALVEMGEGVV